MSKHNLEYLKDIHKDFLEWMLRIQIHSWMHKGQRTMLWYIFQFGFKMNLIKSWMLKDQRTLQWTFAFGA